MSLVIGTFNRTEQINISLKDVEDQYLNLNELGEVLCQLRATCAGIFIYFYMYVMLVNVITSCVAVVQTSRTFLLKFSQPHLLVVPPEQVLKVALSLYMEDNDLPMPTPEEMLICEHLTTSEEVSLTENYIMCTVYIVNFLSRLIFYGKGLHLIQNSRGYSAWYMLRN